MVMSVVEQWKRNFYSQNRRVMEIDTITPGSGDTELYTLPQFGFNTYALRMHFEGTVTDDTTGAVTLATNLMSRMMDIEIQTGEGSKFIKLNGNGGVQVLTTAKNPTIDPGDVRLMGSPFLQWDELDRFDEASGNVTDGAGTALTCNFDIIVPIFIASGEAPHKYRFRWRLTTGTSGTIYATNGAKVASDSWTCQILAELLPPDAMIQKFGFQAQSIGIVVGDNYIQSKLSKNVNIDTYVFHSPLPANLDDVNVDNGDAKIYDTEFDNLLDITGGKYGHCEAMYGIFSSRNGGVAGIVQQIQGGFFNTLYLEMGQALITDALKFKVDLATASQTMRIGELSLVAPGRPATRAEQVTTMPQAPPAVEVVAGGQQNAVFTQTSQNTTNRQGILGLFRPRSP